MIFKSFGLFRKHKLLRMSWKMKSIFEGGVLGAIRGEWVLVVKCKDVDTCIVCFAILKKKKVQCMFQSNL